MIRIDVVDLFMSGSPALLAVAASDVIVDPSLRSFVARAIHWLLANQLVGARGLGDTFRVLLGSGMGLEHSSAVAYAAFFSRVDRWFLQAGVTLRFLISSLCRFRDDIFPSREGGKGIWTCWPGCCAHVLPHRGP